MSLAVHATEQQSINESALYSSFEGEGKQREVISATKSAEIKTDVYPQPRLKSDSHNSQTNNVAGELQKEQFAGELALLRQQSNQLNQVIDSMPTGLVMLDGDGIVVRINDIASQLLDEPILGQPWFDVIKRSFKPREDDWHEVSLKDGRRVKLDITALGNQPGQLIIITDLTQTRLLQDKIGQMQRLSSLGKMVSTLAHQIRTPLSAAMLYGANLKNEKLTDNARESFQEKLMSRLSDLEQQVNDMLLFAKSGSQQVVCTLDFAQVIDESVQGVEALVEENQAKVTFTNNCQQANCHIIGNQTALAGAIQNLIHNSLNVIGQGADIQLHLNEQLGQAYLSVIDNGPGIDLALKDKIFEPFFTSRSQGTGLGLAVVKAVANAHQGDVQLLASQNGGAHFCIRIPTTAVVPSSTEQSPTVQTQKEQSNG